MPKQPPRRPVYSGWMDLAFGTTLPKYRDRQGEGGTKVSNGALLSQGMAFPRGSEAKHCTRAQAIQQIWGNARRRKAWGEN